MPDDELNPIQLIVLMTQYVMTEQFDEAADLARRDSRALEQLVRLLHQPGRNACYGAAIALARVGRPALLPLMQALNDDHHEVREAAALGLGDMRDTGAVPNLISALSDRHYAVRQAAALALGKIGSPEVTLLLLTGLWDEAPVVRRMAATALGMIGDARALPDLEQMAAHDPEARQAAQQAIREIRTRHPDEGKAA